MSRYVEDVGHRLLRLPSLQVALPPWRISDGLGVGPCTKAILGKTGKDRKGSKNNGTSKSSIRK